MSGGLRLRGQVLTPTDAGYHAARQVFNGMIDRRPALIARCAGEHAKWTDAARDVENIGWARDGYARLEPFTQAGAYVNYLFEEPRERVRRAYGEDVYARLVALKDRYDPANIFRLNQNIAPSGRSG